MLRSFSRRFRQHTQGLEHLKCELLRSQKTATEQSERADRLRKQTDLLESRNQEMKKLMALDKAQIRELGAKLRTTEEDRGRTTAKHGEAAEARRALQAAELKHRDQLRERDAKIAELNKALDVERKENGALKSKLRDGAEMEERAKVRALTERAREERTNKVLEDARRELEATEARALAREEELQEQLEEHRAALEFAAEEYGRLASSTISKSPHHKLRRKNGALQVRIFHLERKLANAEAQVQELAHLVRCTKDENVFLAKQLREVETETAFYRQAWKECASEGKQLPNTSELELELVALEKDSLQTAEETMRTLALDSRLWDKYHRLKGEALMLHGSALLKGLLDAQELADQGATQLSAAEQRHTELVASLETLKADHDRVLSELAATNASLAISRDAEQASAKQLEAAQAHTQAEVAKVEQSLQREKEATQRLAATLQKSRIAEEALRDEVQK